MRHDMMNEVTGGLEVARKSCIAGIFTLLSVMALPVLGQDVFTIVDPQDENMLTGPEVGERIPAFSALDQHGVRKHFEDIVGPNGAMIIFFRSADW